MSLCRGVLGNGLRRRRNNSCEGLLHHAMIAFACMHVQRTVHSQLCSAPVPYARGIYSVSLLLHNQLSPLQSRNRTGISLTSGQTPTPRPTNHVTTRQNRLRHRLRRRPAHRRWHRIFVVEVVASSSWSWLHSRAMPTTSPRSRNLESGLRWPARASSLSIVRIAQPDRPHVALPFVPSSWAYEMLG